MKESKTFQLQMKKTKKQTNKILTPTLKEAAKQLFDNTSITMHISDKTNIYIISNKTNYKKKKKKN